MADKGVYVSLVTLNDNDEMVVKVEDPPSSTIDEDPLSIDTKPSKKRDRACLTYFQRQQLVKAFETDQYPDLKKTEDLSLITGLPVERIKVWFRNRRSKWQRENKSINNSGDELNILRSKCNELFMDRNNIAQELEMERFKNNLLNTEVQKLAYRVAQMEDMKKRISRELERETFGDQTYIYFRDFNPNSLQ